MFRGVMLLTNGAPQNPPFFMFFEILPPKVVENSNYATKRFDPMRDQIFDGESARVAALEVPDPMGVTE